MSYLIIGDVHGQLDALERLIAASPKHERRVYLGDIIDRGPKSIESLLFVMNDVRNNGAVFLLGRHEMMMLQAFSASKKHGPVYEWLDNGGGVTYEQFKQLPIDTQLELMNFINSLPLYVEGPGFICSHAPIQYGNITELMGYLDRGGEVARISFVNTILPPVKRDGVVQIFGTFGAPGEYQASIDGTGAYVALDGMSQGNLVSFDWETKQITTQSFMESDDGQEKTEAETKM